MIIWNGYGFLVLAVYLVVGVCNFGLLDLLGFNRELRIEQDWPTGMFFLINGVVLVPLGCYLNERDTNELWDFSTFTEDVFFSDHSLFFIAVEYWGIWSLLMSVAFFANELFLWW